MNTGFIYPCIVGNLDLTHNRCHHNNWRLNLIKVCRDALSSVSVEYTNFPILLDCFTFVIFTR